MILSRRWRCEDCDQITGHLLDAPHPYVPGEDLLFCPACRAVLGSRFAAVCDEPGCDADATTGWPSPRGYRTTCTPHHHQETP